jgi:hypothetical protein
MPESLQPDTQQHAAHRAPPRLRDQPDDQGTESLVNNRIRGGCMTGLIDAISGAGVSG